MTADKSWFHFAAARSRAALVTLFAVSAMLSSGTASASSLALTPTVLALKRSNGAGWSPQDTVAPMGPEVWVTQKALRVLAIVIRNGGKALQVIRSNLDDKASAAFTKHSTKIAQNLEFLADMPDVTTHVVRAFIFEQLTKAGVTPGTAQVIAVAVEAGLKAVIYMGHEK